MPEPPENPPPEPNLPCTPLETDWVIATGWTLSPSVTEVLGPWASRYAHIAAAGDRLVLSGTAALSDDYEDTEVRTFVARNVTPDQPIAFEQSSLRIPGELQRLIATEQGFALAGLGCDDPSDAYLASTLSSPSACPASFVAGFSFESETPWLMWAGSGTRNNPPVLRSSDDGVRFASSGLLGELVDFETGWTDMWNARTRGLVLAIARDGGLVFAPPDGAVQFTADLSPHLVRLSSDGETVWDRSFGGLASVSGVTISADDRVTFTGVFRDPIDLTSLGGPRFCTASSFATYAASLDAEGNLLWARAWESPRDGGATPPGGTVELGDYVGVIGHYGMHELSTDSEAVDGFLRVFDRAGAEVGQLVVPRHLISDAALTEAGSLFVVSRSSDFYSAGLFTPDSIFVGSVQGNVF